MSVSDHTIDLPARLAAEWPPDGWRDVHVLVAVSGGADSVALLCALAAAKRDAAGSGRLFAGHVNHQVRGRAADDDEAWLAEQCRRLGIPLVARRGGAAETSPAAGEEPLRELRYALLVAMAEEVGARYVAVAHTCDDQAETVLFRLMRGSGLRGLAGMPRARPLSPSVSLVRPLLSCARTELRAYLRSIGQSWREDSTNADVRYARNRLRQEVLPRLRENFDVDRSLLRVAEQAAAAEELMASLIEPLWTSCRPAITASSATLWAPPLAGQPPILAAEVLRAVWRQAGWPEQAMTRRWWTTLAELAQATEPRPALNLPGGVLARREGEALRLSRSIP
jgi:tRNA(Ile)-lysidine synthase